MTELSPQETNAVRDQYRDRADGVLNARCIDKIDKLYRLNIAQKTLNRWTFASRVENGKANCYMRMPKDKAEDFKRRRGF